MIYSTSHKYCCCQKKVVIPLTSSDITFEGADEVCLDILKPITLTTVLDKIRAFIKNRLFGITSTSLAITYPTVTCNKIANIEIIPSSDPNNSLTLGTDSRPFVPSSSSYKVYTALLSQSGTNAPTANILENTSGQIVTWTRQGAGVYQIILFNTPPNKIVVFTSTASSPVSYTIYHTCILNGAGPNSILIIRTFANTTGAYISLTGNVDDLLLQPASIEIRIYP